MEIRPFHSLGSLLFNMSRTTARGTLNVHLRPFRKFEDCPEIDVSDELGLHLYYDKHGLLEFVEAFEPATVSFGGMLFLGRKLTEVVAEMETRGCLPTSADEYGVIFADTGVALFAPSGTVEGVAAFRSGYYDI